MRVSLLPFQSGCLLFILCDFYGQDFQYYVTTTEFTEEAILMKVQVSQPLARADLLGTSTGLGEDAHGGE